jgi:hypothetical protein
MAIAVCALAWASSTVDVVGVAAAAAAAPGAAGGVGAVVVQVLAACECVPGHVPSTCHEQKNGSLGCIYKDVLFRPQK